MNSSAETQWPSTLKRTRTRLAVYDELFAQALPISARELFELLSAKNLKISFSTVYRILDAFVSHGIAIQSKPVGDSNVLYGMNIHRHTHFMVCMRCHEKRALQECPLGTSSIHLDSDDFMVVGHQIEILGYCKSCMNLHKKTPESD
ncbi:MAG: transcriptional repressor [Clostridiaceae bacterium]|nr:transcriptional repressor [Clostridiaceae bacterium]